MIEKLVLFSARNRILAALMLTVLLAVGINGIPYLRLDASYDAFISDQDPGKPDYDETVSRFGSDNTTIIYARHDDLFDPGRLRMLEDLVVELKRMPNVDDVTSLFSVISIRDRDNSLDSRPLMPIAPDSREAADSIRDDALYSPLIRDNLLSRDGTVTAINVTVFRDREDDRFNHKIYDHIEELLQPLRGEFDEVFQVGPPRLNVDIERGMMEDMAILTPLSLVVLIASLIFITRMPLAAAIPLVTSSASIAITMGFMGYVDLKLTLLTAIVPSLVIVIGSTEDMHLVAAYLDGLPKKGKSTRRSALKVMAHHAGVASMLAAFTTTIGFMSNGVNDIPLIRDFAFASAFAMGINFVVTILVVPMMLSLFGPLRHPLQNSDDKAEVRGLVGFIITICLRLLRHHGKWLALGTTAVALLFAGLATRVHVSNDPLSYFPGDHPMVVDAQTLHGALSGMQIFYLTVDGGHANAFREPENLKALERVVNHLEQKGAFDKVMSLVDHLSLVNREMRDGDPAYWRVPDQRDLVDQYLLLFQRSDLERYATSDYRHVNVVVRHNISDSHYLNQQLDTLQDQLPALLGPDLSYKLTGENLMINRAAEGLFTGQVQSLLLIGGVVFVMMSIYYTSIFAGLMFLIPNMLPLVLNFGIMGWFGIPLNPGTASVAAIALGVAVDDTIHLFSRYRNEIQAVGDPEVAAANTVRGEAVAVLGTSLSLVAMFATLLTSNFAIVMQFGLLAGLTMIFALFTDLLITPLVLRRVGIVGALEYAALKLPPEITTSCALFIGMTKRQIKKTILLSQRIQAPVGTDIIVQGTRGRSMYVIISGAVDVIVNGNTVRRMGPGNLFGEIGFSGETPRTATIRCHTDVDLMSLDSIRVRKGLRFHSRLYARLTANITAILTERMAQMQHDASHGHHSDVDAPVPGVVLVLEHNGQTVRVSADKPAIAMGRAADCDLVVNADTASRSHATIRMEGRHFMISDHSSNGVYLAGAAAPLEWDTAELPRHGILSLGGKPVDGAPATIRFHIEEEALAAPGSADSQDPALA